MIHKKISELGVTSKLIMLVLMYLIFQMITWAINCERDGIEVAAIMGATLTPITALFKFVMEWSDRKNESHT